MEQGTRKNLKKISLPILIGILVVLSLFMVHRIVRDIRAFRHLPPSQTRHFHSVKDLYSARHMLRPETDAALIKSWMTFDFINRAYHLPPSYLKTKLNITDPSYPRLTVTKIADEHPGETLLSLLDTIRELVRTYLTAPDQQPQ